MSPGAAWRGTAPSRQRRGFVWDRRSTDRFLLLCLSGEVLLEKAAQAGFLKGLDDKVDCAGAKRHYGYLPLWIHRSWTLRSTRWRWWRRQWCDSRKENDIEFGDEFYPAGTEIRTNIDSSLLRLSYQYSILRDSQKEAGVSAGVLQGALRLSQ